MIDAMIEHAKSLHSEYDFLHGGCYALARALTESFGGEILVNREKEHCIAKTHGKCYDITGVVKDTYGYHSFRPKEERRIQKEYFLISPEYTKTLIEKLKVV